MKAHTVTIASRDENTAYISFWLSDSSNPNSKEMKVIDIPNDKVSVLIRVLQDYQKNL